MRYETELIKSSIDLAASRKAPNDNIYDHGDWLEFSSIIESFQEICQSLKIDEHTEKRCYQALLKMSAESERKYTWWEKIKNLNRYLVDEKMTGSSNKAKLFFKHYSPSPPKVMKLIKPTTPLGSNPASSRNSTEFQDKISSTSPNSLQEGLDLSLILNGRPEEFNRSFSKYSLNTSLNESNQSAQSPGINRSSIHDESKYGIDRRGKSGLERHIRFQEVPNANQPIAISQISMNKLEGKAQTSTPQGLSKMIDRATPSKSFTEAKGQTHQYSTPSDRIENYRGDWTLSPSVIQPIQSDTDFPHSPHDLPAASYGATRSPVFKSPRSSKEFSQMLKRSQAMSKYINLKPSDQEVLSYPDLYASEANNPLPISTTSQPNRPLQSRSPAAPAHKEDSPLFVSAKLAALSDGEVVIKPRDVNNSSFELNRSSSESERLKPKSPTPSSQSKSPCAPNHGYGAYNNQIQQDKDLHSLDPVVQNIAAEFKQETHKESFRKPGFDGNSFLVGERTGEDMDKEVASEFILQSPYHPDIVSNLKPAESSLTSRQPNEVRHGPLSTGQRPDYEDIESKQLFEPPFHEPLPLSPLSPFIPVVESSGSLTPLAESKNANHRPNSFSESVGSRSAFSRPLSKNIQRLHRSQEFGPSPLKKIIRAKDGVIDVDSLGLDNHLLNADSNYQETVTSSANLLLIFQDWILTKRHFEDFNETSELYRNPCLSLYHHLFSLNDFVSSIFGMEQWLRDKLKMIVVHEVKYNLFQYWRSQFGVPEKSNRHRRHRMLRKGYESLLEFTMKLRMYRKNSLHAIMMRRSHVQSFQMSPNLHFKKSRASKQANYSTSLSLRDIISDSKSVLTSLSRSGSFNFESFKIKYHDYLYAQDLVFQLFGFRRLFHRTIYIPMIRKVRLKLVQRSLASTFNIWKSQFKASLDKDQALEPLVYHSHQRIVTLKLKRALNQLHFNIYYQKMDRDRLERMRFRIRSKPLFIRALYALRNISFVKCFQALKHNYEENGLVPILKKVSDEHYYHHSLRTSLRRWRRWHRWTNLQRLDGHKTPVNKAILQLLANKKFSASGPFVHEAPSELSPTITKNAKMLPRRILFAPANTSPPRHESSSPAAMSSSHRLQTEYNRSFGLPASVQFLPVVDIEKVHISREMAHKAFLLAIQKRYIKRLRRWGKCTRIYFSLMELNFSQMLSKNSHPRERRKYIHLSNKSSCRVLPTQHAFLYQNENDKRERFKASSPRAKQSGIYPVGAADSRAPLGDPVAQSSIIFQTSSLGVGESSHSLLSNTSPIPQLTIRTQEPTQSLMTHSLPPFEKLYKLIRFNPSDNSLYILTFNGSSHPLSLDLDPRTLSLLDGSLMKKVKLIMPYIGHPLELSDGTRISVTSMLLKATRKWWRYCKEKHVVRTCGRALRDKTNHKRALAFFNQWTNVFQREKRYKLAKKSHVLRKFYQFSLKNVFIKLSYHKTKLRIFKQHIEIFYSHVRQQQENRSLFISHFYNSLMNSMHARALHFLMHHHEVPFVIRHFISHFGTLRFPSNIAEYKQMLVDSEYVKTLTAAMQSIKTISAFHTHMANEMFGMTHLQQKMRKLAAYQPASYGSSREGSNGNLVIKGAEPSSRGPGTPVSSSGISLAGIFAHVPTSPPSSPFYNPSSGNKNRQFRRKSTTSLLVSLDSAFNSPLPSPGPSTPSVAPFGSLGSVGSTNRMVHSSHKSRVGPDRRGPSPVNPATSIMMTEFQDLFNASLNLSYELSDGLKRYYQYRRGLRLLHRRTTEIARIKSCIREIRHRELRYAIGRLLANRSVRQIEKRIRLRSTWTILHQWKANFVYRRAKRLNLQRHFSYLNFQYRSNVYERVWERVWGQKIRVAWSKWNLVTSEINFRIQAVEKARDRSRVRNAFLIIKSVHLAKAFRRRRLIRQGLNSLRKNMHQFFASSEKSREAGHLFCQNIFSGFKYRIFSRIRQRHFGHIAGQYWRKKQLIRHYVHLFKRSVLAYSVRMGEFDADTTLAILAEKETAMQHKLLQNIQNYQETHFDYCSFEYKCPTVDMTLGAAADMQIGHPNLRGSGHGGLPAERQRRSRFNLPKIVAYNEQLRLRSTEQTLSAIETFSGVSSNLVLTSYTANMSIRPSFSEYSPVKSPKKNSTKTPIKPTLQDKSLLSTRQQKKSSPWPILSLSGSDSDSSEAINSFQLSARKREIVPAPKSSLAPRRFPNHSHQSVKAQSRDLFRIVRRSSVRILREQDVNQHREQVDYIHCLYFVRKWVQRVRERKKFEAQCRKSFQIVQLRIYLRRLHRHISQAKYRRLRINTFQLYRGMRQLASYCRLRSEEKQIHRFMAHYYYVVAAKRFILQWRRHNAHCCARRKQILSSEYFHNMRKRAVFLLALRASLSKAYYRKKRQLLKEKETRGFPLNKNFLSRMMNQP